MGGEGGLKKLFGFLMFAIFMKDFRTILWFRIRDVQYKGC